MLITKRRCVTLLVALIVMFSSINTLGQVHKEGHSMMVPSEFTWNEGPTSLPPGTKVAVLEGDPSKEGPFTLRLKVPADYKIAPHWHPAIEHVTVISGTFYMGHGEEFKPEQARELTTGSIAVMAIGERHFAFTKGECEIQLHGIGPWGITYVNDTDDPRKQVVEK